MSHLHDFEHFFHYPLLSLAGHLVLLNSVLSAFAVYWLAVYAMPAWAWREVGGRSMHYGVCGYGRGRRHVSVATVRLHGRGFANHASWDSIDHFGSALRLRWLWSERVEPTRSWVGLPLPVSLAERALFAVACQTIVGDGRRTRF
jgi:hypothetical protein